MIINKQEYCIDEIDDLKESINNIQICGSPNKNLNIILNLIYTCFIEFFCKEYGILHYAFDINNTFYEICP